MSIPTHREWKAFKKLYGVADKAAKGISVGAELEKYAKVRGGPKQNLAALTLLKHKVTNYGKTIDKKKVKKYPEFVTKYKVEVLDPVEKAVALETKRLNEGQKYKNELDKFFTAVGRLGSGAVQGSRNVGSKVMPSYRNFANVIVPGLKAAHANYGGSAPPSLDYVDAELDKITQAFAKLSDNSGLGDFTLFAGVVSDAAREIKELTDDLVYVNLKD